MSRSAVDLVAKVPWQIWAVAGFGVAAAYLVRRASDAVAGAPDAVVKAAKDAAVAAVDNVVMPVVQGLATTQTQKDAAIAATANAAVVYAADAVQSVPGAITVLDWTFGTFDQIFGIKH